MGWDSEYYTTGVWASAASRAALVALITGKPVEEVEVLIPVGRRVILPVETLYVGCGRAEVCAVKVSPEADDVTHGARIVAEATFSPCGVVVEGGSGIGVITKPGLKLPVGEKAINPVPRYYILKNLAEVLRDFRIDDGVRVVISVEDGESIAKKTINPKLGIVGGVSILGTKGTVIPFSTKSFMDSILTELSVARASGIDVVVLAPGRDSMEYARSVMRQLPPEAFVMVGDYIYFAAKHASKMGFSSIHLFAQPGKMAKVAYGFKNTHAKYGSVSMEWLAKALGLPEVACCNTVAEAWAISKERWGVLEALAASRLSQWTGCCAQAHLVPPESCG